MSLDLTTVFILMQQNTNAKSLYVQTDLAIKPNISMFQIFLISGTTVGI